MFQPSSQRVEGVVVVASCVFLNPKMRDKIIKRVKEEKETNIENQSATDVEITLSRPLVNL